MRATKKIEYAAYGEHSKALTQEEEQKFYEHICACESKGFGFVDRRNDKEGMDAIRKLTHAEFFGRKLVVSKARPKISAY